MKKLKVLIAGLLPRQAEIVKKRVKGCQLEFWNKEESYPRLTSKASHSDVCVLAVNFLSHADEKAAKKGSDDIVKVAGGLRSVITATQEVIDHAQ